MSEPMFNDSQLKMIKSFFIFEKESGNPYYYENFEQDVETEQPLEEMEPTAVAAFLSALFSFAQAQPALSDLRTVDMTTVKLSFVEKNGLVFSVLASSLYSPLDLEFKLRTLASLFISEYGETIKNIDGMIDIEQFKPFSYHVRQVLFGETRSIPEQALKASQLVLNRIVKNIKAVRGAALLSFTGDVLYSLRMNSDILVSAIQILEVVHAKNLFQTKYVLVGSETSNLIINRISEGILLIIDSDPRGKIELVLSDLVQYLKALKDIITD